MIAGPTVASPLATRSPLRDSPDVAFLTDEPGSNGFARKARALERGFDELGVRFDAVYIKGGVRARARGSTREIGLGNVRAALSTPLLARYLRRVRPRIALVNSGQMGPSAVLAGRIARHPVVPWEPAFLDREHDLASLPRRMRAMAVAQQVLYRRAPAIAAPSADLARWVVDHRRLPEHRVHVLPNPVDAEAVRADAGSGGDEAGSPFRLCAVGRLVEQKGYDVLIEALARVRDRLPSRWRLTIVGEVGAWSGAWDRRIRTSLRRTGLEGNVELVGHLDNPHRAMRRADLFVHAARWEPFGLVLVEALALGLPIVATDCPGGPAEILGAGRYGRLVPAGEPVALGEAIIELADDPDRRRELAARGPAAAARYSPRVVAERILELAGAVGGGEPGSLGVTGRDPG